MKRRLLSAFLAVMMVLTMAPVAFAADEDAENTADGSASAGTGSSEVTSAVAKIGDVEYPTLQAAVDAAKAKNTIQLVANTDENVTIAKALTLDLNGFTIDGKQVKATPTLTIKDKNVTIKDTSEAKTGTIKREDTAENSGKSSHYVIDIQGSAWVTFESGKVENNSGNDSGKGASLVRVGDDGVNKFPGLNIKGGTFTQDNFIAVKVDRGDLFLNGGTINSVNSYAIEDWHRTTINAGTVNGDVAAWTYSSGANSSIKLNGGIINGNISSVNYGNAEARKATVTITGGTVSGELDTRSYNPQTGELTSIADATKATIEVTGGTFDKDPTAYIANGIIVRTNGDGKYVADKPYIATVGGTGYYDIESAFKAQTTSGQPIILQCDLTNKNVFNSGSINRTLDLNGHTYTYTGSEEAFDINYPDVTLTVKNGTVVSANRIAAIPTAQGRKGTITYDNAALVFDGVTMTANGTSGIESNGMNTNDVVTLKNSTLNVPNGFGIYFPSSGTATIEDSTITAKTMGVQVCAGNLNVKNSTITVTGSAVNKTENDGAIEDGAAISVVDRAGYKGLGKVNIESGKFTSIKAYKWDSSTKVETAFDNSKNVVAVSGGVFAQKFDNSYCATGMTVIDSKDTTYKYTVGTIEVKDENEIQTDTQKGATQATLSSEIAEKDKTAATDVGASVTPTTLTDTTPITADDKAQALTELVKNKKVILESDGTIPKNTTVTVVKETYLDVTVTAYDTTSNTVSMDITPKYNLIATTDKDHRTDANSVTLETKPLTVSEATKVSVTIPAFANNKVYIDHANGKNLYVARADANGKIEFTTNGFSPFTFTLSNPHVVAEVNGNAYTSFQDAVNAVANGGTIDIVGGTSYTATINSGDSKTFTVKNTLGSDITVKVNNDSKTVGKNNGTQSFTYTKPSSGGSSGGSSSGKTTYKVTTSAVNNGGVNASPSNAEKGATITITLSPDKGYKLDKLTVTDGSGKTVSTVKKSDTVYTFTMPASAVKVGVSYVKATETPSKTKFNDVSANDWFASAVDYVTGKGMMNGTADNTFSPKANTTRGMVVTVLYRLENQPSTSAASFTDVASGAYYANAVAWANANGIVSGYGSGKFGPNDKVTREQLAAILYRYAQYKKYDVSVGEDTNILSYTDAQTITQYAIPAIQWACGAGVVTGKSGNKLDPQGNATRAEVAAMLMRFCENVK